MPSIPSTLPPSVEEAYRRKCVQLKNRTNEVEESNDAARLRLARIKRQVEKLRIERAFLLEQVSRRTSTNVEDSDGSPSPPPTPKDKPLRTKRGHRKSAVGDADSKAAGGASFTTNNPASPTESVSQQPNSQAKGANGVSKEDKKPVDAFEVYCNEKRPDLEAKNKDKDGDADVDVNIEEELENEWKKLSDEEKEQYQAKYEETVTKYEEAMAKESEERAKNEENPEAEEADEADEAEETEKVEKVEKAEKKDTKRDSEKPKDQDEDVEMGNYDTEDQEAQDKTEE